MSHLLRCTRILALAGLLASLSGPAAQAQTRFQPPPAAPSLLSSLTGGLWELGRAVWARLGLTLDNGCKMDPDGNCVKADLDNGCQMDPSGQCVKSTLDNGCQMDPDGRPLPQSCFSLY
jgi:hypothetical protein